MSRLVLLVPALAALAASACQQAGSADAAPSPTAAAHATGPDDADLLARGEYLVRIGGCNDCHTPGYPESGGNVPKAQWLVGTPLGWHGPWGTTYPTNLRLYFQGITEGQWLKKAKMLSARPPMPVCGAGVSMGGVAQRAPHSAAPSVTTNVTTIC